VCLYEFAKSLGHRLEYHVAPGVRNKVAVVTDSVAALPRKLVNEYDIHVIPVRITVGGKVYRDTSEDLPPELIHAFQSIPKLDTTPWPPEFYCQVYEELSQKANNVVHIVCFSQFTSTISLARVGAEMAQEAIPHLKVELVDSATVTMAQGFIALAAARAAAAGKDMDGVIEAASLVKSKVNLVFALDSLSYLARTGRISKLAAWSGSFLNVKPIVGLSHGKAHPLALVRSKSQSIRRLVKVMHDSVNSAQPLHAAVMEVERPQEAEELSNMIREQFQPAELYQLQFTPVMQVVAGSGLLGVAFYCGD
jgi:DegV family protein with EDD domain